VPVVKQGRVNPAAFRQISTGSILGEFSDLGLARSGKIRGIYTQNPKNWARGTFLSAWENFEHGNEADYCGI
jgi:hypothetical protein